MDCPHSGSRHSDSAISYQGGLFDSGEKLLMLTQAFKRLSGVLGCICETLSESYTDAH